MEKTMETMERIIPASVEVDPAVVCIEGFLRFTRQKLIDAGLERASQTELLAFKSEYLDGIYGPQPSTDAATDSEPLPHDSANPVDRTATSDNDTSTVEPIDSQSSADKKTRGRRRRNSGFNSILRKTRESRPVRLLGTTALLTAIVTFTGPHIDDLLPDDAVAESTDYNQPAVNEVPTTTTRQDNTPPSTEASQSDNAAFDLETTDGADATTETTAQASTTSSTTSTSTTTSTVETTIPLRVPTLLETVASGNFTLEDMPGTEIGKLSIDGICLDDVAVSVVNEMDPVRQPESMDGVDWSSFNIDVTLPPVNYGDLEGARERLNPLYELRADITPQEPCEMQGTSEYAPRWNRSTAGSQMAKINFETPATITPQSTIHPYSVLPGQSGVTYIQGHRTTESAPFTNLDALTPGQTASFSDGYNTYMYTFQGYETVRPDINIEEVMSRGNPGINTLILSTCDDGSAERLMALFTLQV